MTENASETHLDQATDDQRSLWGVNNLVELDRHDLVDELVQPAAPGPVHRGTLAAHRVVLGLRRRR